MKLSETGNSWVGRNSYLGIGEKIRPLDTLYLFTWYSHGKYTQNNLCVVGFLYSDSVSGS